MKLSSRCKFPSYFVTSLSFAPLAIKMASSLSPVSNPQAPEAVQIIHIPKPGSPRRSFDNSVSEKITSAPEDSAISESPTIADAVSANTTAGKKTAQLTTILSGCATILLPLILLTFLGFLIWIHNEPIDEYYNRYQNALTVVSAQSTSYFTLLLNNKISWHRLSQFSLPLY